MWLKWVNDLVIRADAQGVLLSQPSLSERVIVDGHGCHTALHFGVKAKENQDKVPTLYWLPKLHKNPIKQDLLQILVLVRQQNFLNC